MAVPEYDETSLRAALGRMAPWQRMTFAAACAERLYLAYVRYVAESGRGEPQTVRSALDRVWEAAERDRGVRDSDALVGRLTLLVPDSDVDEWSQWADYGEDAVAATIHALNATHSADPASARAAAHRCIAAVDSAAQVRLDATFDAGDLIRLREDEFVQAELARQARDLEDLGAISAHDPKLVEQVRTRSRIDTATLLGL